MIAYIAQNVTTGSAIGLTDADRRLLCDALESFIDWSDQLALADPLDELSRAEALLQGLRSLSLHDPRTQPSS